VPSALSEGNQRRVRPEGSSEANEAAQKEAREGTERGLEESPPFRRAPFGSVDRGPSRSEHPESRKQAGGFLAMRPGEPCQWSRTPVRRAPPEVAVESPPQRCGGGCGGSEARRRTCHPEMRAGRGPRRGKYRKGGRSLTGFAVVRLQTCGSSRSHQESHPPQSGAGTIHVQSAACQSTFVGASCAGSHEGAEAYTCRANAHASERVVAAGRAQLWPGITHVATEPSSLLLKSTSDESALSLMSVGGVEGFAPRLTPPRRPKDRRRTS
jgi:hypothetical protein